jgi:8-oxo-dGTP diphosphatase
MDDERSRTPTVRVVAAVIEKQGRYLITRRRSGAVLPGLWEFPGGKVEPGEDDATALAREFRERLDVPVCVGNLISHVRHPYESYTVELYLYRCTVEDGPLSCKGVAEYRWATSHEFDDYEFTPADERSMSMLLEV